MKGRKFFIVYISIFILMTLSSCFNLFSLFAPTDPAQVDDVTRLIAIGQQSLNSLDYQTAYDAFSKAYGLAPSNSVAIEGMCTAYVFLRIPITNVIGSVINGAYSNLGFNNAFGVGEFLSTYLYLIVDGKGDGVIPQDDFSVNINFFMFNTLYAAFFIADTDNDLDVQMDTNDYFLISNDLTFVAVLPDVTNNFIKTLALINAMKVKVNGFVNLIEKSEDSLLLLSNSIHSADGMSYLMSIQYQLFSIKDMIVSNFVQVSNLTAMDQFGLSDPNMITNLLFETGVTNYADFTNQMFEAGITNMSDMESMVTNMYPDLTNFNDLIDQYFLSITN